MTGPEIRLATPEDIEAFYGQKSPLTLKALTVVLDGKPVGIGGVAFHGKQLVAFSDLKDDLRPYRKAIWAAAKKGMNLFKGPVIAIADPLEPTASRFLERLGFTHVEGMIYRHG